MDTITVRVTQELLESLEEEAAERDVSRSQLIRDTLVSRHTVEQTDRDTEQIREVEAELTDLRRENERLHRERREQPIWTRAKWWITGEPSTDRHG